MLRSNYPYYLANRPQQPNRDLVVVDKYTREPVTRVALADPPAIFAAIAKADDAADAMRRMSNCERQAVLMHCVQRFSERAEELEKVVCIEAGKPIRDARVEVARLIETFRHAAFETTRMIGEVTPLDVTPRATGYHGMWKRVPIGPCSFITPFNFPLNLPAHKIAPAIAVGCPFVLKPATATPVSAAIIGEVLAETELPSGAFSVLPCRRDGAELLTTDERLRLLSFTGSAGVGWDLKRRAGKKRVLLELGGNAAVIVHADADIDDVVERIANGAFGQAGQSCISVQRVIIHEAVYDEVRDKLVERAKRVKMGDPKDPETIVGPMISESDAERLDSWIQVAVARGGKLLCGGKRDGVMLEPTLIENAPPEERVVDQEAFGPVAVLMKYSRFEDAIRQANNSSYGLQAGVFTRDIFLAQQAWDELQVGGVVIGDVPTWRADNMPYGGSKDSGLGREGVRFAMEEMTEIRMFVLRTPS